MWGPRRMEVLSDKRPERIRSASADRYNSTAGLARQLLPVHFGAWIPFATSVSGTSVKGGSFRDLQVPMRTFFFSHHNETQ